MEERHSGLEIQLRELQDAYGKLFEENQGLQEKIDELEAQVQASEMPLELIKKLVFYTNNPCNRKRVGKSETDFESWQKGVEKYATEPLKRDIHTLKRETGALRGVLFSNEMDRIMNSNPKYKKVGFVYYDFANGKSLYTPALLELFGIDEREAADKRLSLMSFIYYLARENRAELVVALRKGISVENYSTKTRDGSRNLVLNAFPVVYESSPVGVGVFLYDKSIEFDRIGAYRFAIEIKRAMRTISDEFEFIRKDSKIKKVERLMDSPSIDSVSQDTYEETEIRREDFA